MLVFVMAARSAANYLTLGRRLLTSSDLFVVARIELERHIPKTGITAKGFTRHCHSGTRYPIMKKFLFLILGIQA
jgi:hypothetical protein